MNIPGTVLISVVMPTYNHARFIGKAVESVLRQSYANFELIIVDNYSQDDTGAIVAAYGDRRIRYVKFANNGVIAASRNYGISIAKGEYVAFLDSDDLWLPEKLERQLGAFSSGSDTVLVYSRYKTLTGDAVSGQVLPKAGRCVSGFLFRNLYLRRFIACSGVMIKKSILGKTGGFNEAADLAAAEDTDLWLRIALAGRIGCASEAPLFLYRIHEANLSRGYRKKYRLDMMLARKYYTNAGFLNFCLAAALISASVVKQKLRDALTR